MPPTEQYHVRAVYDARGDGQTSGGQVYGNIQDRNTAEACVLALAGRPDVLSATIEEVA